VDALHVEVSVIGNRDTGEGAPISARVDRITASVMQTAPIASERFQDALPLIPGVVRGLTACSTSAALAAIRAR